jgi:enamine deaminase RidA (YjgF/YER057c/UK114 family)
VQLLDPPALPSVPGYSQVAVVPGGGDLIFVAGQVALDATGAVVGIGDFAAQATQAFRNLLAALSAAGATANHLVKLTTFVTDMSQLAAFRSVRDRFLDPAHLPASTLVQVSSLFRPEFLIEVEAIAIR